MEAIADAAEMAVIDVQEEKEVKASLVTRMAATVEMDLRADN